MRFGKGGNDSTFEAEFLGKKKRLGFFPAALPLRPMAPSWSGLNGL
jgi:hypothetical protein